MVVTLQFIRVLDVIDSLPLNVGGCPAHVTVLDITLPLRKPNKGEFQCGEADLQLLCLGAETHFATSLPAAPPMTSAF
jgi:hypothetical protein